jgi:hypothetical protein
VTEILHNTTVTDSISNLGSSGNYSSSEEDGSAILIHGSPISGGELEEDESETGGLRLFDYESDSEVQGGQATTPHSTQADFQVQRQQHVAMDTDPPREAVGRSVVPEMASPELDAVYYQCRSGRTSMYKDTLVSVSQDESFGKKIIAPSTSIGSLEDHGSVTCTFQGSRVMRGNDTVNQSVDPATMVCLSCKSEHPVISKKPSLVLMSDQNFVPTLSTSDGNCIQIVRLENASLAELYELAVEMFGDVTFAEGSILMFGSVSHLSRYGTSMYPRDWMEVVALSSRSWRGVSWPCNQINN